MEDDDLVQRDRRQRAWVGAMAHDWVLGSTADRASLAGWQWWTLDRHRTWGCQSPDYWRRSPASSLQGIPWMSTGERAGSRGWEA